MQRILIATVMYDPNVSNTPSLDNLSILTNDKQPALPQTEQSRKQLALVSQLLVDVVEQVSWAEMMEHFKLHDPDIIGWSDILDLSKKEFNNEDH